MKTTKKGTLLQNLQLTVLAHEFWGDNQYFGSLRPRTALQWYRACYFLWGTILAWGAQSSLGGHNSRLGGTNSDLGGMAPEGELRPRGAGPALKEFKFLTLLVTLVRTIDAGVTSGGF